MKSSSITAICIYHKGSYSNLRDSYNIILKYIEDNGYEITDNARECYIDGCWNKENEDDYLSIFSKDKKGWRLHRKTSKFLHK